MGNINGGKFRMNYINVDHLVRLYDLYWKEILEFKSIADVSENKCSVLRLMRFSPTRPYARLMSWDGLSDGTVVVPTSKEEASLPMLL